MLDQIEAKCQYLLAKIRIKNDLYLINNNINVMKFYIVQWQWQISPILSINMHNFSAIINVCMKLLCISIKPSQHDGSNQAKYFLSAHSVFWNVLNIQRSAHIQENATTINPFF